MFPSYRSFSCIVDNRWKSTWKSIESVVQRAFIEWGKKYRILRKFLEILKLLLLWRHKDKHQKALRHKVYLSLVVGHLKVSSSCCTREFDKTMLKWKVWNITKTKLFAVFHEKLLRDSGAGDSMWASQLFTRQSHKVKPENWVWPCLKCFFPACNIWAFPSQGSHVPSSFSASPVATRLEWRLRTRIASENLKKLRNLWAFLPPF